MHSKFMQNTTNMVHRFILRLLVFYLVSLYGVNTAFALSPQLKSVLLTTDPMTTAIQRYDANGDICALVKVIVPGNKVTFEGNVVGTCEFKTSEYWCYLSPNTRFLKIKYPNMDPLMVDFHEHIGTGVQSRRIYEIHIAIPSSIRSTGVPIKLSIEKQNDYYDSRFSTECKVRTALIKLESVDVYVNLKNDIFDSHLKVSENFNDILLGDIHVGDIITIIPSSDAYHTERITIVDSVVTKNLLNTKLYRKGAPIKGVFVDENTGTPISNVSIDLCVLNPTQRSSYWGSPSKKDVIYKTTTTDRDGKYEVRNCFYKYIYNVQYSAPGYQCPSFDVIPMSDTITYTKKLAPIAFDIIVTDGKKPLKGATINCKNIYNTTFQTDELGKATIVGAIDKSFIIKLEGFETLEIINKYNDTQTIKMRRGNSNTIKKAKYDYIKEKIRYL